MQNCRNKFDGEPLVLAVAHMVANTKSQQGRAFYENICFLSNLKKKEQEKAHG